MSAQINQYGGTATITNLQFAQNGIGSGGTYHCQDGNLNLPGGLTLMGDSGSSQTYLQAGGTNQTTSVFLQPGIFGTSPSFTLNGRCCQTIM